MNIYDDANQFARALKDCDEVKALKEAGVKVKGNDSSKKMLDDFRKIQFEAYNEYMTSGKVSPEVEDKMKNLGSVIALNPDVAAYLQAEQRFSVMWDDVLKILNEAIGLDANFSK